MNALALVVTAALMLPSWLTSDHKAHLDVTPADRGATKVLWSNADITTQIKGRPCEGLILVVDVPTQAVVLPANIVGTRKLMFEPGPHHIWLRAAAIDDETMPPHLDLGPVQAELEFTVPEPAIDR